MKEDNITVIGLTREDLIDIVKEGVKLELNRQRALGNPSIRHIDLKGEVEYLTRDETSEKLKVTVQTLNNWRRDGKLIPVKIGGKVLYIKEDVYNLQKSA